MPIGTHGRVENERFILDAMIGSLDGRRVLKESISGDVRNAEQLGAELADRLIALGGKEILDEIRNAGQG